MVYHYVCEKLDLQHKVLRTLSLCVYYGNALLKFYRHNQSMSYKERGIKTINTRLVAQTREAFFGGVLMSLCTKQISISHYIFEP